MKLWIVLLGVVVLATVGTGLTSSAPSGMLSVSDAEAGTLFGGFCWDVTGTELQCGGVPPCMDGYGAQWVAPGSGQLANANCGASACGTFLVTLPDPCES